MICSAKCPYCGTINPTDVKPEQIIGREIVCCDPEGGGCDGYFVAFWSVNVRVECKTIEGQREMSEAHRKEMVDDNA